jgi:NAD(P)-dependent dehydrogenase (short-subunit alcohol dehydrogenase family)
MARTALVTGGTRGIGRAITERLKQDGFKVAAGYSGNDEAARATAAELGVTIVKGNVGNFEDASARFRRSRRSLARSRSWSTTPASRVTAFSIR